MTEEVAGRVVKLRAEPYSWPSDQWRKNCVPWGWQEWSQPQSTVSEGQGSEASALANKNYPPKVATR